MRQFLVTAHVLGAFLGVFALAFGLPLAWSLAVEDGAHRGFAIAAAISALTGIALWWPTRRLRRELQPRDGALLVVMCWVSATLVASIPFLLELPGIRFTDAFFESMAGLTTTGATVITGLDHLPQSLNIWRHALQWFGGMGIIVLAVAILPLLGVGGMQLYKAEMPGPMKEGKLTPRITQTAKYLWLLYAGLTLACMLSLRLAGLSWFEAVCHAFSTLALGGFSTRDASIAGFGSLAVELIMIAFMLIAVLNFATHFRALTTRSPRVYLRDPEAAWVFVVIGFSCLALGAFLYWNGTYPSLVEALRYAAFNTVSLATSSGFMSADYGSWPLFGSMWLLLLATLTSSTGSTGGGIKMFRAIILVRQTGHELMRLIHPRAVRPLVVGGQVIEQRVVLAVLGYMLLWGVTTLVLTFAMLATGMDFVTAFSVVVACVNNLGPALGEVGPTQNYQQLSDLQTWMMAVAMLAGRLELLTFFVIFTPAFWRK
ncbi:MAG: TrkH family potassium uptake protein [Burkholderiaceae bacterium]|nr:TrkH family potassium uptake protein [Burkholderiaceae bacterium]